VIARRGGQILLLMQQARRDNRYRQQYAEAGQHRQFHPSRPGVGNREHEKENHRENEQAVKQVHGRSLRWRHDGGRAQLRMWEGSR